MEKVHLQVNSTNQTKIIVNIEHPKIPLQTLEVTQMLDPANWNQNQQRVARILANPKQQTKSTRTLYSI